MQKSSLVGKVALITGAARRVGAEIARTLHNEGMNIVLHYHLSQEDANQLCKKLNQKRENSAVAVCNDLIEIDHLKALIQQAHDAWGRLDAIVNNASQFYKTMMGKVTSFAWDDLMNINLKAPFFLAHEAVPFLKETKGLIVNIADVHGEKPMRDYSVYCISKGGLLMMTKVLAKELGPSIRVNAISPGIILWPEGENALTSEIKEKIIAGTILKQAGNPLDIAKAVLFFVRDADYITGEILNIDGGRMLS